MAEERGENRIQEARQRLLRMARDQGVNPVDLRVLLSEGPRGPEDENADMMIAEIYRWRHQDKDREISD